MNKPVLMALTVSLCLMEVAFFMLGIGGKLMIALGVLGGLTIGVVALFSSKTGKTIGN